MTVAGLARSRADRIADYGLWHRAQVATGDLDPMYPVLDRFAALHVLSPAERSWLVLLHVAWYHPGSTFSAWKIAPRASDLPRTYDGLEAAGLLNLPCGTERRGHRTRTALAKHLLALGDLHDPEAWIVNTLIPAGDDERHRWTALNDALTTIHGNGRWAAYKTAEMLQKVGGWRITAADAGHRYSSGPRKGLADLGYTVPGNRPDDIATLDQFTAGLARMIGEPDIAQVETSLCDYHSLLAGRYYLGHDIDAMQGDLMSARLPVGSIPPEVWAARAASFPAPLLGEYNGWVGVRKHRNPVYRNSGVMMNVERYAA